MLRTIIIALAVVASVAPAFAADGYNEYSKTCLGNNIIQHCGTTNGGNYQCWDEYVSQCPH